MLIAYLEKMQNEHANDMALSDLESFYRQAKKCMMKMPSLPKKRVTMC
ncbi:arginine--tRNA ligase [Orbaceae bacterium ESL0721]|nr:arginine--tRNA ligase [Orbaceae bacterium ESL0721]